MLKTPYADDVDVRAAPLSPYVVHGVAWPLSHSTTCCPVVVVQLSGVEAVTIPDPSVLVANSDKRSKLLEPEEAEATSGVADMMRTGDCEAFTQPAPSWAGTLGVTRLSCSS